MEQLKAHEAEVDAHPDKQVSLTDQDARSMKSRGNGIVGYNVQTAVDGDGSLETCRSGDGNRGGVAGIDGSLGMNGGGENEKREQSSGARKRHVH